MSSNDVSASVLAGTDSKVHWPKAELTRAPQPHLPRIEELTTQIVEIAGMFPDVSGTRLWRPEKTGPRLWQQSGNIPAADSVDQKAISAGAVPIESKTSWTYTLSRNEEVLGILEIHAREPINVATLALLEKFAQIAAAALGSAAEEQEVHNLSEMLEATKLLNSTLDLPELLDVILLLSRRLCGSDRGTVFLVDRQRNQIWSLRGLGLNKYEIRLSMEKGIAGWVARYGDAVRVEDASADSRFDPAVDHELDYRTRELLAVPIRDKDGGIIGVLELVNKQNGVFSAADEKLLSHLSIHVAVALEKAQLHREIVAKQRLESDLTLARNVQRGLLPEKLPKLERFDIAVAYAPTSMVGGDYYDFMLLKPKSLLAVIADVEGKGIASALMMANLQAILHTLSSNVHALEHLVNFVNEAIFRDARAQKLLSMFVAVIDERHQALHYINAGHVPPTIIRSTGEVHLSEGGLVLGVVPDATYTRGRVDLYPGDILVAYTDGVTEAMDVHEEQYGLQRLVDLIRANQSASAARIVETILTEVDQFSTGGPIADDRVVLMFKFN
jgi:phosphoserine phosphatase RsbU/P